MTGRIDNEAFRQKVMSAEEAAEFALANVSAG